MIAPVSPCFLVHQESTVQRSNGFPKGADMPRMPRVTQASLPMHVVQRGINKQAVFSSDAERRTYLEFLQQAAAKFGARVHAYVLMSNHVHLLVSGERDDSVSRVMHHLGTRYVRYFNARHGRTSTLWEGRFHSSIIQSDRYFLAAARYIELNPVRAGMVSSPGDYFWSSYSSNATGLENPLLTPHAVYVELGGDRRSRAQCYRSLFDCEIPMEISGQFSVSARSGWVLGEEKFCRRLEAITRQRVRPRQRGGARSGAGHPANNAARPDSKEPVPIE